MKKTNAVEVELPEGESTVKLIKLSEAAQSVIAIDSFEVDGKPQPTEAAKHSIEFIGDSITCGYGVDDPLGKSFSIYNEERRLDVVLRQRLQNRLRAAVFIACVKGQIELLLCLIAEIDRVIAPQRLL